MKAIVQEGERMRPDTQTLQKYATNAELQFEKWNNCQIISGNSYIGKL